MAFTPDSTVYLLDTPLDSLQKNQIRFSSEESQSQYFASKMKHTFDDVTYQRKDKVIRVGKHIDELWNVNYVMYRNKNFSTKWFYAFITKMEYMSEGRTDVYIETDVYQTWMLECQVKESFVIREHVRDDSIGLHLVDEQLETGEYIVDGTGRLGDYEPYWNVLAVSDVIGGSEETLGSIYGNVATGLVYYSFPNTPEGLDWLKNTIAGYDNDGKSDAINMIFTVPEFILGGGEGWIGGKPLQSNRINNFKAVTLSKPLTDLNGYVPKNKKLLTGAYKYLYLSNGSGQSAVYHYEDFSTSSMLFKIKGGLMPNTTLIALPSDYKGSNKLNDVEGSASNNYDYGLTLTGFPLGAWTSDAYTAWFAQNGASAGVGLAGSVVALGAGIATGNVMAIGGGALGVFSQMAQINKAMMQPDQARGQVGSGSLRFSERTLDFYYSHMTIKKEFAKRIDDYLTMYGYKVNALKVPDMNSRTHWNYVQTIDVNIDGAIPTEDMTKLKNIFNSGVTLWHSASNFLNYGLTNSIR